MRFRSMSDARLGALVLVVSALLVMGSFHQTGTGWNVNSRMALVFAVVDRKTFAIDAYDGPQEALATMDKAVIHGHDYSDKVFGVSLVGVPVYAAMKAIARAGRFTWSFAAKMFVLRFVCASIPAALSVGLLFVMMVRNGADPRRSLFAVAAAFFGSLWFGYSTIAMPYSAGIACCLGAMYVLLYRTDASITSSRAFVVGLLCGLAMIFDFIFGLIVVPIAVVFLMRALGQPGRRWVAPLVGAAIGGALPLIAFFAYTYAIFGVPSIPYRYEASELFRDEMAKGFVGITRPRLGPAWFLTFHPYRGVLFWSPWIAVALAGCALGTSAPGARRIWSWLGLWAFASSLAFNSGYYMWWGGWAMGARLMLPMMAAVPMGLAEVCRRDRSRVWWGALVVTGVASILLSLPLSLTDPQVPQLHADSDLMGATVSTSLRAPQFDVLRSFYKGDWFAGTDHRYPQLALAVAAAMLVLAAVRMRANRQPTPTA